MNQYRQPALEAPWYLNGSNSGGGVLYQFAFGAEGDQPLACDWNGDGKDTYGYYRSGTWNITNSTSLAFGLDTFSWGLPGDRAVCGDWDGNGTETIGLFRPSTAEWFFRNANNAGGVDATFTWGLPDTNTAGGDIPVAGDWDGNGTDTMGIRRGDTYILSNVLAAGPPAATIPWGWTTDKPVVGDWDGNGTDTIGVVRADNGTARWLLSNNNSTVQHDFVWGTAYQAPLSGDWCVAALGCSAGDNIDTPALVG